MAIGSQDQGRTAVGKDNSLTTNWSIPPFCDKNTDGYPSAPEIRDNPDQSFVLTQGVVYQIDNDSSAMVQNISENEDDFIEWSQHGDPCGIWMKLDVGNILEVLPGAGLFLYNRTHKQNCKVSLTVNR